MKYSTTLLLGGLAVTLAVFSATLTDSPPADAAFPGDNGRIAYVKYVQWGDRNRWQNQIFTMKPNGTDQRQLTNSKYDNYSPSWSSDGAAIAFDRLTGSGTYYHRAEIYTMRADGSRVTRLTNNSARDSDPSWSPDGTTIAFKSHRDGDSGIFTMSSDGSGVSRLTSMPGEAPTWSPDGTRIAFIRPGYDSDRDVYADDLYVMNADGSGEPALVAAYDQVGYPEYGMASADWSPDGQWIAFDIDRGFGNSVEIYKVRPDGTQLTNLQTRRYGGMYPAWSPDGKKIAYDSPGWDEDNPWALYTMNADGSEQRRIVSGARGLGREVSWQPLD